MSRFLQTIIFLALSFITLTAQSISSASIDSLVERTLKTFDVPGIAVAVIKDGKVVHSKGYGVRSLNSKKAVDEHTLFGIASNSKAFTSAALSILADEGKITFDDRVIDYIPEFRMYNAYVTEEFTIRDLVTHRSGLGLGAGDLMFWPDSNKFTIKDIIHNLRYLKPTSQFRTKYDYDNLLYMVAGEIISRVSGMSWEDFVESRIMRPLGMQNTVGDYDRIKNKTNVIDAHAFVNGSVQVVKRDNFAFGNSAGGIYSSIYDLSKWVIVQLNNGKYGEGLTSQLFSKEKQNDMWSAQTIMPISSTPGHKTLFTAYGLGWRLRDVNGYKEISHTGAVTGMYTQTILMPELNLGVLVLTNQQVGAAFNAISTQIKDRYLGINNTDRVKEYKERLQSNLNTADKITNDVWQTVTNNSKSTDLKMDITKYAGTFKDNWFGNISITTLNGRIFFTSAKSPRLKGEMFFYKASTFVVKWYDRSFDADAFVMYGLNSEGKATTINMEAISPLTDFSYDFQDLDFVRIEK